jgi:2-oxoglutarate ferredoxin oxidoreductase subunit delta
MSRIVIDESKCKGCGLCTTVCPFDLIRIADRFNAKGYCPAEYINGSLSEHEGKTVATGLGRYLDASMPTDASAHNCLKPSVQCTGCGNCAAMCPDAAITVYRTRSRRFARTGVPADTLLTKRATHSATQPYNKGNGRAGQKKNAPEHR